MTDEQRIDAFLEELKGLTIKHKIAISGCGCCGSPWLNMEPNVSFDDAAYTHDGGEHVGWSVPYKRIEPTSVTTQAVESKDGLKE